MLSIYPLHDSFVISNKGIDIQRTIKVFVIHYLNTPEIQNSHHNCNRVAYQHISVKTVIIFAKQILVKITTTKLTDISASIV